MGQTLPRRPDLGVRCCVNGGAAQGELQFSVVEDGASDLPEGDAMFIGNGLVPIRFPLQQQQCCQLQPAPVNPSEPPLESLSYVPLRFDESCTIDMERSQARYAKIAAHSTRARTQRRTKVWEEWLREAAVGQPVTILTGIDSSDESPAGCVRTPARYTVDKSLTTLSFVPADDGDEPVSRIPVDNIQVICPAMDFMLFVDKVEGELDEKEKSRAVLVQYVTADTERKRVCFLAHSETEKDRFVQALTALWLEKRNDHSMWF